MRLRPLFFVLLLALYGAGTASAQVVISAQVGRPYYGRGYYPPVAPPVVVAPPPPVYYAPAPVYYAPRPVYYAPRPVYYAPRPYYGPGRGHGWGHGRRW